MMRSFIEKRRYVMNKFNWLANKIVTFVIALTLIASLLSHSEASDGSGDRMGWRVFVSTGMKFSDLASTGAGIWINDFGGPFAGFMLTGDFDGDGRTDIAGWNEDVKGWDVRLSSGSGFDKDGGGFWIEGFGGPSAGFMLTGDFDGDGRTDIAGWNEDVKGWDVRLSSGSGFDKDGGGFWIEGFGYPFAGHMLTGDFDGDGKTDIAGWNEGIRGWHVALSSGTGFNKTGSGFWIEGFGGPSAGFMLTGDFDGDGRTDIAGWNEDVKGWDVRLSSGSGFDKDGGGFWIEGFGYPFAGYMLTGDFDGDGKTDIAGWNETIRGWHVALSSGVGFDKVGSGFWLRGEGRPSPGFMLTGNFSGTDPDGKSRTDIASWNRLRRPEAPYALGVTGATESSLTCSWLELSDNEKGFHIHYTGGGLIDAKDRIDTPHELDGGLVTHTITGLVADHDYTIYVTAYNDAGESEKSEEVIGHTKKPKTEPAEPADIAFVDIWIEPAYPNPNEKFTLYWSLCNAGGLSTNKFTNRLERDNTLERGGPAETRSIMTDSLPPLACIRQSAEYASGLPSGDHFWYVYLDYANDVKESNESNNIGSLGTVSFVIEPFTLNCLVGVVRRAAQGQNSTAVYYPLPAPNRPEGATVACSPPSGSNFPLGVTTVTCVSNNALGESAACSFTVNVR
jgi:hypothetical protein